MEATSTGAAAVGGEESPPIVELRGISKFFPGVVANKDVDLSVRRGEIHALLGENGAGKSTLMNILTGIYHADGGEILIDGRAVRFASPIDAIAAGIGMVHQHFKLVQAFTVAENIHLGWDQTPRRASSAELHARSQSLSERFNLALKPNARVSELSAGEQQRVEILRVLARDARLLILDEPTAVLTPAEARDLFKALREFREGGNAVIFISHKLEEVLEISDRVTVLRGGHKVATEATADCSHRLLARLMVGRDIVFGDFRRAIPPRTEDRAPVLSLRKAAALDDRGSPALDGVDLDVHAGEILGIGGVAGNGQRELSQVLTGMRDLTAGVVTIEDRPAPKTPAGFAAMGIGHIPEDRLRSGLAPSLSITDNAVMREYRKPPVSRSYFYDPRAATELARTIAASANVAVPDFGMPVRNLSGGNQQRLIARREMRVASRVLIAAYPSRGLDVAAINTMMHYLVELRNAGVGVVLFSEDLEELLNLSDRIAVLYEGRIMGVFPAGDADLEVIGLLMGGKQLHAEVT